MGYKIIVDGKTVVYLPGYNFPKLKKDVERYSKLIDFCRHADVLIHETYFKKSDVDFQDDWGHCSFDQGIELANACEPEKFVCFGYQPGLTDKQLDKIIGEYKSQSKESKYEIIASTEGYELML